MLDEGKAWMDMETFAVMQFVKFSLSVKKRSAVDLFAECDPMKGTVNPELADAMRTAWGGNKETTCRKGEETGG